MRRLGVLWLSLLSCAAVNEALAAGNAHIVDDSEVETPGVCHLELWVTKYVPGDGYANAAPACTLKTLPMVEIGAAYQHYWDQAIGAPLFGPQFKVNFQSADFHPVGLGLGLNAGVNLKTGELGLASLLALVTVPIDKKVRLNLNAGWSYLRDDAHTRNALFYGGQFEANVGFDLTIMIEMFGRASGAAGAQVGLRYTPNNGPIDFDLLFGSFLDSASSRFITLGVTMRW